MAVSALFILLVCSFVVHGAVPSPRTTVERDFNMWMAENNKAYATAEYQTRLANYMVNVKKVAELNANSKAENSTAVFALNKFADLSAVELKALLGLKRELPSVHPHFRLREQNTTLQGPTSFDWRTQDKLTPVKNQGQCGSCWAFSCAESIESVYMIAKGLTGKTMPPLGPQQIVDCDHTGAYGCGGGDLPTCYNYVKSAGGLERETDYPYHARDGTCVADKSKEFVKINGWKYVIPSGSRDENAMANFLSANSPMSIIVDAQSWSFYKSGVLKASQCGETLDHAVQAVGYNIPSGYWIVRNSWGTSWGQQGYIYLEFGKSTCGMTTEVTVPTL